MICARHTAAVDAFAVCRHVVAGAYAAHRVEPTGPGPHGLGELLCLPCHARDGGPALADLVLLCAECVDRLLATGSL